MKKVISFAGLAVCLLVLPLAAGCGSADEVDEFDVFKIEEFGFSVEYPKGWSVKIITCEEDDIRVVFNGQVGKGLGKGELFVGCDRGLTYMEWFNIWDSPRVAGTLITRDAPESVDGIPYHVFVTVTTEGENAKVYLCDKQSFVLDVFRLFTVGSLTQQQVDKLEEYALHMISTASLE